MRQFTDDTLLIATHNAGKLEEISNLLSDVGIAVIGAAEKNLPEPVEDSTTFVENARTKAHTACQATGLPALSDDSGIEVDALDRAPGVYTADWAETPNGRDFQMAMEKTHKRLLNVGASQPWSARFCATFVLAWPDGHDEVFEGKVEGHFVWPMRGSNGHGYDPIFQPIGHNITFGEMEADTKKLISHRADAFRKLKAALSHG